jgi:hypothetical protein
MIGRLFISAETEKGLKNENPELFTSLRRLNERYCDFAGSILNS